jgi:hypothetical protein
MPVAQGTGDLCAVASVSLSQLVRVGTYSMCACRITLHIKEDAEDLLEDNELNRLIRTYSEFISFPIRLWTTKQESKQVEDTEATKKKQEEADKAAEEKGEVCLELVRTSASLYQCIWNSVCDCNPLKLVVAALKFVHQCGASSGFASTIPFYSFTGVSASRGHIGFCYCRRRSQWILS